MLKSLPRIAHGRFLKHEQNITEHKWQKDTKKYYFGCLAIKFHWESILNNQIRVLYTDDIWNYIMYVINVLLKIKKFYLKF